VRLGSLLFVSASDEDYILRIYNHRAPAKACGTVDLAPFLKPADPDKEPDIEGAAVVGGRIYWVTSHGRNKDREEQESRQRFFATSVHVSGEDVQIVPVGRPSRGSSGISSAHENSASSGSNARPRWHQRSAVV
jgi:hypothetical protein